MLLNMAVISAFMSLLHVLLPVMRQSGTRSVIAAIVSAYGAPLFVDHKCRLMKACKNAS